jgi:SAM-dependent methyltransferase
MRRNSYLLALVRRLPPAHAAAINLEAYARLARVGIRTRDTDLLRRAMAVRSLSQSSIGWVPGHRTRFWEYPWALQQVDRRMPERIKRAADVGAGTSPVPIALSQMGLHTTVADPAEKTGGTRSREWGLADYSRFGIEMQRTGMQALDLERASQGFVLCISVIEHVPAKVRRAGLAEFARVLEPNGVCVLTVDLMRNTDRLWNRMRDQQVDPGDEHGSLADLVAEAAGCELKVENMARCPLRGRRVDVVGLVFRKSPAAQPAA